MKSLTVLVGGFCLVLALAYGGFRLYRWFNWTFGYEDMVKQTVEMMVKPECLKK